MKKVFLSGVLLVTFLAVWQVSAKENIKSWWAFQSIDTMKYSRDLAREKNSDSSFDKTIDAQVKRIAETGATHVAIATPYDSEFVPFLSRWVKAARKYDLNVWFRGNWSGWENWFGYQSINRSDHLLKTKQFILSHKSLFEDGDVFTACPECENGGPGDPRHNEDVVGHRKFLIDEYKVTKEAFGQIDKIVQSNYNSMNGDVASLIMDKQTTTALDGLVVVDHYVATPEKLVSDIKRYAERSGGKVVLGEFGAPIPDIHGKMTDAQQANWLRNAMILLATTPELVGVNYWTSHGSSTQLWTDSGEARPAANVLKSYFLPRMIEITIKDQAGRSLGAASLIYAGHELLANSDGKVDLPVIAEQTEFSVLAPNYNSVTLAVPEGADLEVVLAKTQESWLFKLKKLLFQRWEIIIP